MYGEPTLRYGLDVYKSEECSQAAKLKKTISGTQQTLKP